MSYNDVLLGARRLSRPDQVRLLESLSTDLQRPTKNPLEEIVPGVEYEIWSPHDAFEAAMAMQDLLEKTKTQQ